MSVGPVVALRVREKLKWRGFGWRETWCHSCGRRRKRDKWEHYACPQCGAPPPFYTTIIQPIKTPLLAILGPTRSSGILHSWMEDK